jgi:excisionase family DNA binding protein
MIIRVGEGFMFDDRFVSALATELAAKLIPQIEYGQSKQRPTARLLTVKDAASYIGRSEQAVQHMIHKRELVVVRKGRRVHLDRGDLDRWIEANKIRLLRCGHILLRRRARAECSGSQVKVGVSATLGRAGLVIDRDAGEHNGFPIGELGDQR